MGKLRDGVMQRGSTWSYVIRVSNPDTGLSRPRWVGGFPTERAAKKARDEARASVHRAEFIDRSGTTVSAYLVEWLDSHTVEVKPRTLANYRYITARYVVPHIGALRLQAVLPATLTKLYRTLRESGGAKGQPLSARTVDYVHAILRKALNDAVQVERLLPSNPAERAKRPRREVATRRDVWTPEQLRASLSRARNHRLYAYFHVAAYSGARRGELLNLRWSSVDLAAARMAIRGSAGVVNGTWIEGSTKSGHERVISLDPETVDVLRAHRVEQDRERVAAGSDWAAGDYVFTRGAGAHLYPDTVTQLVPKFIAAYNATAAEPLPPARLHDLRHVHATVLLLAGVPAHVVADRLGHADPSITLRVYAHVLHDDTVRVAEVFATAMQRPGRTS